jgi:hypothetical protein
MSSTTPVGLAPRDGAASSRGRGHGAPVAAAALSRMAVALRGAGPIAAGVPTMVGGTTYALDLSHVPEGEARAFAAAEAMEAAHMSLPPGAGFDIGCGDPARLGSVRSIAFVLPTSEAVELVEMMRGSLALPPGGDADEVPIRIRHGMPICYTNVTFAGCLPALLQRKGIGQLLLGELGYSDVRVVAEFHPTVTLRPGGEPRPAMHTLQLWVSAPVDDPHMSRLPPVIGVGSASVAVYVANCPATGDAAEAARPSSPPPSEQQRPPSPPVAATTGARQVPVQRPEGGGRGSAGGSGSSEGGEAYQPPQKRGRAGAAQRRTVSPLGASGHRLPRGAHASGRPSPGWQFLAAPVLERIARLGSGPPSG